MLLSLFDVFVIQETCVWMDFAAFSAVQ